MPLMALAVLKCKYMGKAEKSRYILILPIPAKVSPLKFDTVFQPGYTTRQRGWGLVYRLTKRMVQNYHNGQIFVRDSEVG
jgi:two-component system, sporulation sensor kinase D